MAQYPQSSEAIAQQLIKRFEQLKVEAEREAQQYAGIGQPLAEFEVPIISESATVPDISTLYIEEEKAESMMPYPSMTMQEAPSTEPLQEITAVYDVTEPMSMKEVDLVSLTTLENKDYVTADLVNYLYSTTPNKVVPHTAQYISDVQANNIISLITQGSRVIKLSPTSDAAYSLPFKDFALGSEDEAVIEEFITKSAAEKEGVTEGEYVRDAFGKYAVLLAMLIGNYAQSKPQVNFGIARYLNATGQAIQDYPMGKDIEIIAWLIDKQFNNVARDIENFDMLKVELMNAFDLSEDEADMYLLPWVTGMQYVLEKEEIDQFKQDMTSAPNPQNVIYHLSQSVEDAAQSEPRQLLAAHLSDEVFSKRLSKVDVDLLDSQAKTIPIIGSKTASIRTAPDEGETFVIKSSELARGVPLFIPLSYDIGAETARIRSYDELQPKISSVIDTNQDKVVIEYDMPC